MIAAIAFALALACLPARAVPQNQSSTPPNQRSDPNNQNPPPPANPSDTAPPKSPDAAPPVSPGESSSRKPGDDLPPDDVSDATPSDNPPASPPKPKNSKTVKSTPPPPPEPVPGQPDPYDPYHANKSVEIGSYYQRRGNLDAAADRYKDAIRYKPDFAKPRLLLAEIYEKKHDYPEAIRYYNEYLKILPNGPEAKRAKERIEKLSQHSDAAN
jgi:tetratricopeptide (TPR) repeat protein